MESTENLEKINRVDALDKVTGNAKYPGDFFRPDQLSLKVLFSERSHAVVRNIEIEEAENIPGVVAILTSKDVPNNEFGLIQPDQPVLCGPGSNKLYADHVRCYADKVALIIAESEEIASEARKKIKVHYDDLEIVDNVIDAFKSNRILIHPEKDSNIFCHNKIRHGNFDDPFRNADVIIESEYNTPVQEHAYLQPEAGIAFYDESGKMTVIVGGQWTHEDQEQIAHSLKISPKEIRVIYPAIGGAFGGREDMSVQIILGLAVMKLKERGILRPLKIVWSREESIIGHHKRHAYSINSKWGATKNGRLVGAEITIIADGGAYVNTSTKVLGNATLLSTGPYNIPNVKVDAFAVFTNNTPAGAFRGFGGPQAAFEAESQMNKLADSLGIDPVEFRLMNTIKEGESTSVGSPLPMGITIDEVIKVCAEKSGWKLDDRGHYYLPTNENQNSNLKRGIGFACGYKNIGFSFGAPENCWATIELYGKSEIDYAILKHAGAEVGQGSHTAFSILAARALDLPVEKIRLIVSDTESSKNAGSVSASRMTFMAGNAIIGAAKEALNNWKKEDRPAIGEFEYIPPRTTPLDPETGKCDPNFAYGYVAESVTSLVDIETGEIDIENVIVVDDVGMAVNLPAIEGQVEGAISQALGYAITENFIQKKGKVLTDKFSTYLIPTVLDMPKKVQSVILENPDLLGPFGVRGMGEMPYLPFVPALTHSLYKSTGTWFDAFPLTPDRIIEKLNEK
jgi:CO/xanthine dehydrogenase Mo-binding subunit